MLLHLMNIFHKVKCNWDKEQQFYIRLETKEMKCRKPFSQTSAVKSGKRFIANHINHKKYGVYL